MNFDKHTLDRIVNRYVRITTKIRGKEHCLAGVVGYDDLYLVLNPYQFCDPSEESLVDIVKDHVIGDTHTEMLLKQKEIQSIEIIDKSKEESREELDDFLFEEHSVPLYEQDPFYIADHDLEDDMNIDADALSPPPETQELYDPMQDLEFEVEQAPENPDVEPVIEEPPQNYNPVKLPPVEDLRFMKNQSEEHNEVEELLGEKDSEYTLDETTLLTRTEGDNLNNKKDRPKNGIDGLLPLKLPDPKKLKENKD